MTWVRQSDDLVDDARTTNAARHLGPNGIGRAVAVVTEFLGYCNRNLSDGYVETIVAARFKTDRRPLDVLFALALPLRATNEPGWLTGSVEEGWTYVDYHKTQPSRATVLENRQKDAHRKKVHRKALTVKEGELRRVLRELAEAEYRRLPQPMQLAVRAGMRSEFAEIVKTAAALMELPYTSPMVGRAIDEVVHGHLARS